MFIILKDIDRSINALFQRFSGQTPSDIIFHIKMADDEVWVYVVIGVAVFMLVSLNPLNAVLLVTKLCFISNINN